MINWLPTFQFIILIILIIIFILYIYNKRKSEKTLTYMVETFQVTTESDIQTPFFDLSANYFSLTDAEIGTNTTPPLDLQILQIGGSYGEIDIANLPWDAENNAVTASDALWGAIPVNATMAIFEKVYGGNQLTNINNLSYDEDSNKFHYNNTMFGFGTDSKSAAADLDNVNAAMQIGMDIMVAHMLEKNITNLVRLGNVSRSIAIGTMNAAEGAKAMAAISGKGGLISGPIFDALKNATKYAGKVSVGVGGIVKNVVANSKTGKAIGSGILKMGSAVKGSSARIVDSVVNNSAIKKAGRTISSAGAKAAGKLGIVKKMFAKIAEKLGIKAMLLLVRGIIGAYIQEQVQLASDVATLDPGKAALDAILWNMLIAVLMVLQMSGITDKILTKISDSQGCCPEGTLALDQFIPEWLNLILTFTVEAWGGIVTIFSPYICIGANPFISLKETTNLPKYIKYNWLSCSFLNWPDYECTAVSVLPLAGKTYIPTAKDSAGPGGILNLNPIAIMASFAQGNGDYGSLINHFISIYSSSPSPYDWTNKQNANIGYTNFDEIAQNPSAFTGQSKTYSGFKATIQYTPILGENYTKQDIGDTVAGSMATTAHENNDINLGGFFYIDFTEPTVLADIGQFYYDWASRNPYDNGDGTVTIDYISKISYITASSLYSCDVMCEMISATYNINTGEKYSENTTYDHDRRFYYSCNPNNPPTPYWENCNNQAWKNADDTYDAAYYALNDITNVYTNISSEEDQTYQHTIQNEMGDPIEDLTLLPTADYLLTAFVQANEASNRYVTASNLYMSNNNSYSFNALDDGNVRSFYNTYNLSNDIYNTILQMTANWIGLNPSDIQPYVTNVVNASNMLWLLHQAQRPVEEKNTPINTQYKIVGCTHLDGTAPCASAPDITKGWLETRFYTQFDVTPYIKRCELININIGRCMDVSNIQLTVLEYYEQNPNKRIKTINSIKAKGKNVCSYIWDEVDIDPETLAEVNYSKNVETDTIYQIDLSSCTFHLPEKLYGTQQNYKSTSVYDSTLSPTTDTLYIYKNPLTKNDPNYSDMVPLKALPANYYEITLSDIDPVSGKQELEKATLSNTYDVIPRYDPLTFAPLPEIIRPKQPIRIFYPPPIESNLGTYSNEYCSDPATLNNFIIDYNTNTKNVNKIASIIRTFGTASNLCDMEVDMYIPDKNTMERVTLSYFMKGAEGFQNPTNHEVFYIDSNVNSMTVANNLCLSNGYTLATFDQLSQAQSNGALWSQYGWIANDMINVYTPTNSMSASGISSYGVNCYGVKPPIGNPAIIPFNEGQYTEFEDYTYSSLNNSNGLNITVNTALLPDPYSSGFEFSTPYLTQMKNDMAPNVTFFNDDLIKGFTSKTKGLRDMTDKLLIRLTSTQVLGGSQCANPPPPYHVRCDDPVIIQRIIEQYNIDNTPGDRFGVTQNTMTNVVQSSTNSSDTCHLIFENDKEQWGDYYNKGNTSSTNYLTQNNLYLKEIKMMNNGTCDFFPVPNQIYTDISASDIALASEDNLSNYATPIRNCTIPVNGTQYLQQAINNYIIATGNTINSISYYMNINLTTWDYMINQTISFGENGNLNQAQDNVLRIYYTNNDIYNGSNNCTPNWSYKSGNFQLQILDSADFSIYISDQYVLDRIVVIDTSTFTNASPLFTYPDPLLTNIVQRY